MLGTLGAGRCRWEAAADWAFCMKPSSSGARHPIGPVPPPSSRAKLGLGVIWRATFTGNAVLRGCCSSLIARMPRAASRLDLLLRSAAAWAWDGIFDLHAQREGWRSKEKNVSGGRHARSMEDGPGHAPLWRHRMRRADRSELPGRSVGHHPRPDHESRRADAARGTRRPGLV